jgi:hypothetical protein
LDYWIEFRKIDFCDQNSIRLEGTIPNPSRNQGWFVMRPCGSGLVLDFLKKVHNSKIARLQRKRGPRSAKFHCSSNGGSAWRRPVEIVDKYTPYGGTVSRAKSGTRALVSAAKCRQNRRDREQGSKVLWAV